MKAISELLGGLGDKLKTLAKKNAVVGKKISVGQQHVIPLVQLSMGFGGGGGSGDVQAESGSQGGKGTGGGAGGGMKAAPVAVIIIDDKGVRLSSLEA